MIALGRKKTQLKERKEKSASPLRVKSKTESGSFASRAKKEVKKLAKKSTKRREPSSKGSKGF